MAFSEYLNFIIGLNIQIRLINQSCYISVNPSSNKSLKSLVQRVLTKKRGEKQKVSSFIGEIDALFFPFVYWGLKKAVTTRLAVLAGLFRIVYSIYQFFENFVNELCAHDIKNQNTNPVIGGKKFQL